MHLKQYKLSKKINKEDMKKLNFEYMHNIDKWRCLLSESVTIYVDVNGVVWGYQKEYYETAYDTNEGIKLYENMVVELKKLEKIKKVGLI